MNLSEVDEKARLIADRLGVTGSVPRNGVRQVLALTESVGRLAGSFRATSGLHQRSGDMEQVTNDLTAVAVTLFVAAAELGVDLGAAIERELTVVFGRTDWQGPSSQ